MQNSTGDVAYWMYLPCLTDWDMAGGYSLSRPKLGYRRGRLELAGEYSEDLGITVWRAATCIPWPPKDDGTRHFPMSFRGERTPMVGRPGVRTPILPLPLDAGLLEGDDA